MGETLKLQFDRADTNGDGLIDYPEFAQLLNRLLGAPKDRNLIPDSRLRSFWMQLCDKARGDVDFRKFIPWYFGCFHSNGSFTSQSPLVNFYRAVRPFPGIGQSLRDN